MNNKVTKIYLIKNCGIVSIFFKRHISGEEYIEDDTKGPHVRLLGLVGLTQQNLRRRIGFRAAIGLAQLVQTRGHILGEAKVTEFYVSARVNHQVLQL